MDLLHNTGVTEIDNLFMIEVLSYDSTIYIHAVLRS